AGDGAHFGEKHGREGAVPPVGEDAARVQTHQGGSEQHVFARSVAEHDGLFPAGGGGVQMAALPQEFVGVGLAQIFGDGEVRIHSAVHEKKLVRVEEKIGVDV